MRAQIKLIHLKDIETEMNKLKSCQQTLKKYIHTIQNLYR